MKRNIVPCAVIAICWVIVLSVTPLRDMFLAQTFRAGQIVPAIVPDLAESMDDPARRISNLDNPTSIATAIQKNTPKLHSWRLAGELDDVNLEKNQEDGIRSPERKEKNEYSYTPAQWEYMLAQCKRGQELDPDNAYFDMMEAYWQFAEFRDDAAWAAIRRAGKKSRMDDYALSRAKSVIAEREEALHRRLL